MPENPLASLKAFYLDAALSDCTIVFVPRQQGHRSSSRSTRGIKRKLAAPPASDEGASGKQLPPGLESIPGHRLVLAACSPYFQALFSRWQQGRDQQVQVEYDGPEGLAAAKACIKTMYLQALPSSEDFSSVAGPLIPLLLKVLHYADLWQATSCTELCMSSLAKQELQDLSPQYINGMLELPECQRASPTFSEVEDTCLRWLLRTFGDMWSTVTTDSRRAAFCELCQLAIELWMGSDELAGVENEVAVLLTAWHQSPQGQAASDDNLERLSDLLRVKNLAPSTRMDTLYHLSWFRKDTELTKLSVIAGESGSLERNASRTGIEFPAAWLADPRRGSLPPDASPSQASRSEYVWRAAAGDLAALIEEEKAASEEQYLQSSTFFCKGAFFQGSVQVSKGGSEGGLSLELACDLGYPIPSILKVRYTLGFERQGARVAVISNDSFFEDGFCLGSEAKSIAAEAIDWGEMGQQQPENGFFTFFFVVHEVK